MRARSAPKPATTSGGRALASAVRAAALALLLAFAIAPAALAEPTFPPLTGRVVDQANILPPETEAALDQKLAALEARTTDQVVVVTLPSLQGYEIEEYGYQLGRKWGIGQKGEDNGALLIVAPNERKVRLEVGYGLEPILTDALSSVIIQQRILPRFREGDYPGGITSGVDAVVEQLTLDRAEALKRAQAAAAQPQAVSVDPTAIIVVVLIAFFVLSSLLRAFGGRRRRDSGLLPILIWSALGSGRGGGGGWGGGGFGGGGGSFGGGGASGGW